MSEAGNLEARVAELEAALRIADHALAGGNALKDNIALLEWFRDLLAEVVSPEARDVYRALPERIALIKHAREVARAAAAGRAKANV